MKKIISILLVLTMFFSTSAMMSYAAGEKVSFVIASDTHYDYDKIAKLTSKTELQIDEKTGDYDIDTAFITHDNAYSHVSVSGQLHYESGAILDAFLEMAAAEDAKYVILSGDLTENGSSTATEAMVAKLKAFEASSKKSVFVIPGNHDVQKITKSEFKSYYNDFGYDKAIAQDSASLSYTVDVDGDYRLLMIDTTAEKKSGYELDEARVNWIKAQCEQAKNDKKHIIAVMHHNILKHFALEFMHEGATIDDSFGLKELFCEYDVKYTFSGHTHAQDIMQYTGENGNVIYEVVSGALNAFPVAYRLASFSDSEANLSSKYITSVDTSDFAAMGINESVIKDAKADFRGYAHTAYRYGIKELFGETLCAATLKEYLDVNYEDNQEVTRIVDKIGKKLEETMRMPLYDKDKDDPFYVNQNVTVPLLDRFNGEPILDEDGNPIMVAKYSIEEIAKSYDGVMPATHYKDLLDVMVLLYETHVSGGEGIKYHSDEFWIAINGLAAGLNYCLYSVSEGEYGVLIKFIAEKFEPTILGKLPSNLYAYMASGKEGFEQNVIFMTYFIAPLIKGMISDSIPSDRDISLDAYKPYETSAPTPEAPQEKPKEDKSGIAAFFDKIIEFFRTIFKVLTFQGIFK